MFLSTMFFKSKHRSGYPTDMVSKMERGKKILNSTKVWVYWDQLDANCLVLFYYTFFTLHVSDVIHIHPQERHIMYMQSDTGKCTVI